MNKDFYTLTKKENDENTYLSTYTYEEKKSKFICYLYSISNESDAKLFIEKIKNDNKSARHVVYIYSYKENNNINIRFSDDGEPQGTGTKAIYENMQKENITNICVVIVRYFGGILLGSGPLLRAYFKSYKEAKDKCKIEKIYKYVEFNFTISYSNYDLINSYIKEYESKNDIKNVVTKFNDNIEISLNIKENEYNFFKEKIVRYLIT